MTATAERAVATKTARTVNGGDPDTVEAALGAEVAVGVAVGAVPVWQERTTFWLANSAMSWHAVPLYAVHAAEQSEDTVPQNSIVGLAASEQFALA